MNVLYAKLAGFAGLFAAGFIAAWWVQGVRLDAAENETQQVRNGFEKYIVQQQEALNDHNRNAAQRQQETSDAWAANLEKLRADHGAFARCVAAGRCGPAVRDRVCANESPARPGDRQDAAVQATPGTDGPNGGATVPVAPGVAGEDPNPQLTAECRYVTGKINALRRGIERQPGY